MHILYVYMYTIPLVLSLILCGPLCSLTHSLPPTLTPPPLHRVDVYVYMWLGTHFWRERFILVEFLGFLNGAIVDLSEYVFEMVRDR